MNERFLVRGNRLSNGKLVVGYLFETEKESLINYKSIGAEKICSVLDPESVEPFAVKAKISDSGVYHICPNCDRLISEREPSHGKIKIPYCKWCGQRIDWS